MKQVFRYRLIKSVLLGICILYLVSFSQDFLYEKQPSGIFDSLITEEMLLLAPELRGNFIRNYTWPGLSKENAPEIGVRADGFDISDLSVWGGGTIGKRSAGLLLTGFDHETNGKQDLNETYTGDSVEVRDLNSKFSIRAKTYITPILQDLFSGISGEFLYGNSFFSNRRTYWDTSGSSQRIDSTNNNYLFIHLRALHPMQRSFSYADWWFYKNEILDVNNINESKNNFYHWGYLIGWAGVLPQQYTWRVSFNNEYGHFVNQSENYNLKYSTWAIDGVFTRERHCGPVEQYCGAQLRLFLTEQKDMVGGTSNGSGCKLTFPFLLKYNPVSSVSFFSSCKITLYYRYIHGENFNDSDSPDYILMRSPQAAGNVIKSNLYFSPLSVQWSPSKHHAVSMIPTLDNSGVFNASLEWRVKF